jgi:hypothetical protein
MAMSFEHAKLSYQHEIESTSGIEPVRRNALIASALQQWRTVAEACGRVDEVPRVPLQYTRDGEMANLSFESLGIAGKRS